MRAVLLCCVVIIAATAQQKPPPQPAAAAPRDVARVYAEICAACHGPGGLLYVALNDPGRIVRLEPVE